MGRTPAGETRERIYRFVRDRLLGGFPPTVREVKEAFGFRSVQTAREHLEALVTEGRLAKEAGKARGYRLGGDSRPTRLIPLLGRVPAGPLNIATEDLEGYLPIQGHRSGDDLFGLRVRGESMTGAGILPGDIVVVRRQPAADSGDIVVALIGGEATVKRLRIRRRRVELHPENPAFEPIIPDPADLTLLGKVIEVRRYLERP
ncbi:MAG: regulatory protein LexA [Deltaproteobacteria bacterium]|nr:regulatory protein LexA [Deltaproteobacteria bacterium]